MAEAATPEAAANLSAPSDVEAAWAEAVASAENDDTEQDVLGVAAGVKDEGEDEGEEVRP